MSLEEEIRKDINKYNNKLPEDIRKKHEDELIKKIMKEGYNPELISLLGKIGYVSSVNVLKNIIINPGKKDPIERDKIIFACTTSLEEIKHKNPELEEYINNVLNKILYK